MAQEDAAMGMTASGTGGHKADINVTPMIDVLLVLLIIFMLVAPVAPKGLEALVPQPPREPDLGPRPQDIVISVAPNGVVELNQERMDATELRTRLARIFEVRGDAVVFVRGEGGLDFHEIAQVIDLARGVGLTRVALMTRP
jgi:biopolymer transport protein ExbD